MCTDPENDVITYTLKFNRGIVYNSNPARRNLVEMDDTIMRGLISMVADGSARRLRISGDIKDYGVATYQMVYTCKDEFNTVLIDFPFRVVVFDSQVNTVVDPQPLRSKFFKSATYSLPVDPSMFGNTYATTGFTYSIVGTLNDGGI